MLLEARLSFIFKLTIRICWKFEKLERNNWEPAFVISWAIDDTKSKNYYSNKSQTQ